MSRFIIRNGSGQEWPMDGENGVWFSNVQGLGTQNNKNLADLGDGFSDFLNSGNYPNVPVSGDLFFMPPNAYQVYRSFANFALASEELFLLYQPYGTETFYRRVVIEYLTKGVTDKRGRLDCPVSFIPLTPWYKQQSVNLLLEEPDVNAMAYDFEYSEDLTYASDFTGDYSAEISVAGHLPSAVTITSAGYIRHPVLTLSGRNSGKEYARCDINALVTGLDYSSLLRDSYIRDYQGHDLLNAVSLEHDPYIHIPVEEPCILHLQADEIEGNVLVRIVSYYRSV